MDRPAEIREKPPGRKTDNVSVWRADHGTWWVEHTAQNGGSDPWKVDNITEEFAKALRARRLRQGAQIIEAFGAELRRGPVLDYGCGQGAFLDQLIAAGIEARGCDIGVPDSANHKGNDRFLLLDEPWTIPEGGPWTTIAMLDVLEHHPDPVAFLRALPDPKYLLIKVPLLTGPIGVVAKGAFRAGRPSLMEALLLIGDVSPHLSFFTRDGLDAVLDEAGYRRHRVLRQCDVGRELPSRVRSNLTTSMSRPTRLVLSAGGAALAAMAPLWTDTASVLYERK